MRFRLWTKPSQKIYRSLGFPEFTGAKWSVSLSAGPTVVSEAVRAADVALLVVHGGVVVFFLYRFARHRRPSSLACALLPVGWMLIACWDLDVFTSGQYGLYHWLGVLLGVLMIHTLIRTEVMDQPDVRK